MPAGAVNVNQIIKQLMPVVNQRLQDLQSGKVTPGSSGASSAAPWLSTPGFTGGQDIGKNVALVLPGGSKVTQAEYAALPAKTQSALNSVAELESQGFGEHHQSFLGGLWHNIERPAKGIIGAIESATNNADKNYAHENPLQRIVSNAKALGSGFDKGWNDKAKAASVGDLLNEFAKDPNYKAPSWLPQQLNPQAQDALHRTGVGKVAEGFVGDVGLDPLSYVGVGELAKVKTLGRTAANLAKAQKVEARLAASGHPATNVIETLMGSPDIKEGMRFAKSALPNARDKANAMARALHISKVYGDLSFTDHFAANQLKAAKHLESQGFKEYHNLADFQKNVMPGARPIDMNRWNTKIITEQKKLAGQWSGTRDAWIQAQSRDLLDMAAHSNLASTKQVMKDQLEKSLGIKFAGKTVASVRAPEFLTSATQRAFANSAALGKLQEFHTAVGEGFNKLFRTGLHVDPLVNAMRASRHASIVDQMNNHVANLRDIYQPVSRANMKRAAEATARGQTHVVIPAGFDHETGQPVHHLVNYLTHDVNHLQSQIKSLKEFRDFNNALPNYYQIPDKYFKKHPTDWLRQAWDQHFLLDPNHPDFQTFREQLGANPAKFMLTMKQAAFSAQADRELERQYIERFGHVLQHTDPATGKLIGKPDKVVKRLMDEHGYRTPTFVKARGANRKIIKAYQGVIFPPEVADGIEAVWKMTHGDANFRIPGMHSAPARFFNDVTGMFKTVVTKFNPGFHERNLFGEIMSSTADGVVSTKPYRKALQVLRLHGTLDPATGDSLRGALRLGRDAHSMRIQNGINPDAYANAKIAHIPGDKKILDKQFKINGVDRNITPDILWHAFVDSGLKTGWISTEMGKYGIGRRGAKLFKGVNQGLQHTTENIEDYARLAHFISRIERSHMTNWDAAVEEAAGYVRKFHFDYNDFTQFEKQIMSKAFPFYKWTRKNMALQWTLLHQKPAYLATQLHGLNAISNAAGFPNNGSQIPTAEEVMPQWLKDHLAVPIGAGSSGVRYMDMPLPATDAYKMLGSSPLTAFQNAMYMANPIPKAAFEVATQHQIGGTPIQAQRYIGGQTPYTNLLMNLLNKNNTGKNTNLLQFLLGAGFVENTPARINSELKRRQTADAAARKKWNKAHNVVLKATVP